MAKAGSFRAGSFRSAPALSPPSEQPRPEASQSSADGAGGPARPPPARPAARRARLLGDRSQSIDDTPYGFSRFPCRYCPAPWAQRQRVHSLELIIEIEIDC
jgi:hypothetical protein